MNTPWLSVVSNVLRNRLRRSALGGMWRHLEVPRDAKIHLVAATKLSEEAFWSESLLGRSLEKWRDLASLRWTIRFGNRKGLPRVYNELMAQERTTDVMIFMHDDVWLADQEWINKVLVALKTFDVVGVAGNRRRQQGQCTWAFNPAIASGFHWDHPHLSGRIAHGTDLLHEYAEFGAAPARCELLDGVFFAVNARVLRASRVQFDTRFSFHFYDLDFCRSARKAGLLLGTWPIDLVHASGGSFSSPSWISMKQVFLDKWPA
jgi:hypothetical protein